MKHLHLFEYFQKTRTPKELALAWSGGRLNPLEHGVFSGRGIELNKKTFKRSSKNGIQTSSLTLFTFPNTDDLLRSIKSMDGNPVGPKDAKVLVDYGISAGLSQNANIESYDVILLPDSSSALLQELLAGINDIDPYGKRWNPRVIKKAFTKRICDQVEWDMEKINGLSSDSTRNQVLRIVENMKGNPDIFKLSKHLQFPPYRKFVKRFMDITPEAQEAVRGKRVLIIDDFVTDGTTKRQMRDLVIPFGPSAVMNLALFNIKGTGSSKSD